MRERSHIRSQVHGAERLRRPEVHSSSNRPRARVRGSQKVDRRRGGLPVLTFEPRPRGGRQPYAAGGDDLQPLLAALRTAENRRLRLAEALEGMGAGYNAFTSRTAAEFEEHVLEKLADWRGMMRLEAPEARQVLRQIIADRVALTPRDRDRERVYRYAGRFNFGGLFEGIVRPHLLASQTDPSWNQIHRFLVDMANLRGSIESAA